jgi:RimJ/RimL family protein N-acetyltransferase
LLGGLSPAQFLRRHWQKKPLLVRGAFPGFADPLSPEALAGLACEDDVESRLVLERGGGPPWRVRVGPQSPARLRRLPATHWTLLVQGVDRLVPAVAALALPFRFVPDWRIDDVMVSFAPRFGSVGPHVDSYDVFLLQGRGRRRWAIDAHDRLIGGVELDQIDWRNRSAALAVWIGDRAYRQRGCGSDAMGLAINYAFKLLGLNRVGYLVAATNEPAVQAYRHVGFVEEGRMRQALYRDGGYHDVVSLGLLREDWRDESPVQEQVVPAQA